MDDMTYQAPPPAAGHNLPPAPLTPPQVAAYLAETHTSLTRRRDELAQGIAAFLKAHPVIETEDVAAAATENINMLGKALRMAEGQRKAAKEPYLEGGRAVDAWFNQVKAGMDLSLAAIRVPATAYATRLEERQRAVATEAARVRQAEADRLAAEAEAAAAANAPAAPTLYDAAITASRDAEKASDHAQAKPGVHSRTVGSYGSVSTLREAFEVEVTDASQVPREYMVVDQALLRRAVAGGVRLIPGCRIYPTKTLVTR